MDRDYLIFMAVFFGVIFGGIFYSDYTSHVERMKCMELGGRYQKPSCVLPEKAKP